MNIRRCVVLASVLVLSTAMTLEASADAPTVSITYPPSGAIIDEALTPAILLQASAADPDEAILAVSFFACASPCSAPTNVANVAAAPFQVLWTPPKVSSQTAVTLAYQVWAQAQNVIGQMRQSATIQFTLVQPPPAPSVTLVAPNGPGGETGYVTPTAPVLYATATPGETSPASTIARVDFLDGSSLIGTVTSPNAVPSGYAIVWPNAPAGMHLISARATDTMGYSATSSPITVYIVAPDPPPQVTLTSPRTGQMFAPGNSVPLAASASSGLGTVQRVEFMTGDTIIDTVLSPPYVGSWVNPPPGNFAIVARAYDDIGVAATSPASYIQVLVSPRAPSVVLTAPAPGATVAAGAPLPLSAVALAPDGAIGHVDFYAGATMLGSATTDPYQFAWTNPSAGAQSLTAKAYDLQGNAGTSAPVTVTVTSNQPPTVALTAPSAGAQFAAPATIALAATASDSDGVVTKVEFLAGAVKIATATSPPYTTTWSDVPAGSYTLTAIATDNLGAAATSSAVAVIVTSSPPAVSLTEPYAGQVYQAPADIRITAAATATANPIARVDFLGDGVLLGSRTSTPYTFTWSGLAEGSHSVRARVVDTAGLSADAVVTVSVQPVSLTIVSPAATEGASATISSDSVLVHGRYVSEPNTGITANGIPVETDSAGNFAINNLPLTAGDNRVDLVLTTIGGTTLTKTINVGSSATAPFQVAALPDNGVAPLTVTLTAASRSGQRPQSVTVTSLAGGVFDSSSFDGETLGTITFTKPGLYLPQVVLTYGTEQSYAQTVAIVVRDAALMDRMFIDMFKRFTGAVGARDKAGALQYFTEHNRSQYGAALDALDANLPAIVESFKAFGGIGLGADVAQYALKRSVDGKTKIYLIEFLRDADGVWRLDSW